MSRTTATASTFGLALALVVLVLAGCSTEKDAFLNRTFHRLTTRDNGWFNANTKLDERVAEMEKAYEFDFDEVLPIFIVGSEEDAKAMVPDMEKCIEKCSTVIDRHNMEIAGKQKNVWIDDSYFVIGKAHFYKRSYFDAERTFDYIGRRFKGEDRQAEARLWLARTYIEGQQYAKAQSVLDEVKNMKELPKRFPHDHLSAVQADLDLRRGKVDDAIVSLERAATIAEAKSDRVRWSFILAQLYQVKGQEDKAVAQYQKVARMNPPYEMGFHAQIFEVLAFDRGSSDALRKRLRRMLKDEKHVDHFDMIHYALADLDLKENKDSAAIVELKTSCRVSTTDTRQKAKSFLRLADLYFDDRVYPAAQAYYDSTVSLIDEEHKRFEEVSTRAEVLGELVEQLNIIAREDSLQAFAQLDPKEQEKQIRRMIKERERAEEEKKAQEAESRELTTNPTPDAPKPGGGGSTGGDKGNWYFYNPQQVSRGAAEFKKKWGNRPLEDNWRRKDKGGSLTSESPEEGGEEAAEGSDGKEGGKEAGDEPWKDPASYMKDVPSDTAALAASNAKVCSALYVAGTIYKEKLRDIDNAIESFEVLNNRFEDCRYTPESHYQLYRIYLDKERTGNFFDLEGKGSKYYADIIIERWPDSEFARLVKDPALLMNDEKNRQQEEAAYEALYREHRNGNHLQVITGCNTVLANEPANHLRAKYQLLKAMAVGGLHQPDAFRAALTEVVTLYAGTDEAKAAADILAALDKQAAGTKVSEATAEPEGYQFEEGTHQVLLIYPTSAGSVDQAKARISDFCAQVMRGEKIDVTSSLLDDQQRLVVLSSFPSSEKAMELIGLFQAERSKLRGINDKGYPLFAITPGNFALLFKSKDVEGYRAFFLERYVTGKK
ncbi:MAG: tetratricopeptide repeat protein [Flavobacteriales bacterium]|nr:tetratricopeptide repeat protein [Flavobacteriales bacterium]